MIRALGTHAGCGGQVVAPAGHRYCRRCMLTSLVTAIELTPDSAPCACRRCQVVLTDDNLGQWPATGCCLDCEDAALRSAIADMEARRTA